MSGSTAMVSESIGLSGKDAITPTAPGTIRVQRSQCYDIN
jgi:hypothetical protein